MEFRMIETDRMNFVRLDGGVKDCGFATALSCSQSDIPVFAAILISRIPTNLIILRSSEQQATTAWVRAYTGHRKTC